jgi:hypothetical protein
MKHPRGALAVVLLCLNLGVAYAEDHHAHAPAPDGRAVLELDPDERAMIQEEMRLFLSGVLQMTAVRGKPDMPAVADAARNLGQKMVHEVPPTLRAKLPLEFRQLGFSVHRDFDQITHFAESLKEVSYSLNQLSDTRQNA